MTEKLKLLDLFSGVGGFSLGLERSQAFETVAFCEIDSFCRKVLRKHWPDVPQYEDVQTLTAEQLVRDGIGVDAIYGGFPCQDISQAGKGLGIMDGTRSGLWSEMVRLVRELRPKFLIVENVAILLSRGIDRVLGDLAASGYDAEWAIIRGTDVGVPQSRPRIFIVAYPSQSCGEPILYQAPIDVVRNNAWLDAKSGDASDLDNESCGPRPLPLLGNDIWAAIPDRERSGNNERLSSGMDRYRGLGNSLIPQIPELIGRGIASRL